MQIYHDGTDSIIKNNKAAGDIKILSGSSEFLRIDGGEGRTVSTRNMRFEDGAQAQFGAGADLHIYHNGSDSYINEGGAGDLYIQTNGTNMFIRDSSTGHSFISMNTGSSNVILKQSGSNKLETTADGINVTGDIRASGDIFANQYIVSSSVTHLTQSFSSGSTLFGDSPDDTHLFTGSLKLTGSATITSGSINLETLGEGLQFYNGSNYTTNRITLTTAENLQFRCGGVFQFDENIQILDGHQMRFKNTNNTGSIDLINSTPTSRLDFKTGSKFLMSISSSGDVSASGNIIGGLTASFGKSTAGYAQIYGDAGGAIYSSNGHVKSWTNNDSYNHHWYKPNGSSISMTISSSGNVGINTEKPEELLHVSSSSNSILQVETSNYDKQAGIYFDTLRSGSGMGKSKLYKSGSQTYWSLDSALIWNSNGMKWMAGDNHNLQIYSSSANNVQSTEYVRFDHSERRVGIGTSTPASKLTVAGNISASGNIETNTIVTNRDDLTIQNTTDDGDIKFESDNGSGGVAEYFRLDGGITSLIASKDLLMAVDGDGGKLKFGASQDLEIYHNGTDTIIDNKTGNLFITASSTGRIEFEGNITASGNISSSGHVKARYYDAHTVATGYRLGGSNIVYFKDEYYTFGRQGADVLVSGSSINLGKPGDTNTHVTASGNISASAASTSSFGSAMFTNLPTTEPVTTGSLWISGSSAAHPNSGYLMVFNP